MPVINMRINLHGIFLQYLWLLSEWIFDAIIVGEIQEFETANSLLIKQMVSVLLAFST
jgi:hypothetical protein